jgi:hypothetical protein
MWVLLGLALLTPLAAISYFTISCGCLEEAFSRVALALWPSVLWDRPLDDYYRVLMYSPPVVCIRNCWTHRTGTKLNPDPLWGYVAERVLERVMNSIRNGLGIRETEIAREPSRP